MRKDQIKDRVQRRGLNKWYQNGCKGLLEYATGSGKTRCGVLAAEHVAEQVPGARILILSPMENIRDIVWPEEFRKWGSEEVLRNNVELSCIQTAYKYSGEHYDLVIGDEYDALVSEEFINFFRNNSYDRFLALSAYVPEDKEEFMSITEAYPVERIDLSQAKQLGLISDHIEYAVPVPMTDVERRLYRDLDQKLDKYAESRYLGGRPSAYKNSSRIMRKYRGKDIKNMDQRIQEAIRDARGYWSSMTGRMHALYKMESKADHVNEILDMDPIDRSVVFFKNTKVADRLSDQRADSTSYHSNRKGSKAHMKRWSKGKYDHLVTCEKINRGINIPKVNYAILAGSNSSRRDRVQRTGRVLRNEESDLSYVIDLYYPDSQDQKWLEKSLGSDVDKVHWLSGIEDLRARIEKKKEE